MIKNELYRLQVDIIALQETRLPESGIIRERDYSFFWQGKAAVKTREYGCLPILLRIVKSFHDDMKGTVLYDGTTSNTFNILSGVKQGCVFATTLFGFFFATLLKHAFGKSTEGIYLRTRSDGNRFKLSRLRSKTRVH